MEIQVGQDSLSVKGNDLRIEKYITPEFKVLLVKFHEKFQSRRKKLLLARVERQKKYDQGEVPAHVDQSSFAVTGNWSVAKIPEDLKKRRVEITGPVSDPKMVINMLSRNSNGHRADMAMLDFEDSMQPSWENVLSGIDNIFEGVRGSLEYQKPGTEKVYKLDPKDMAKLMVRVRGLHMDEENVLVHHEPVSAGLFDLLTTAFYNAKDLIASNQTPKFYVPKCEHYLEARWWNDLFSFLEDELDLPRSSIRATFLIETLPAAFQIEEILYELREHAVALNVGRWDKIFSDIKILKMHPDKIAPDRATINMSKFWMDNYAKKLIKICHEREAFAMGGMSAFTPGNTLEIRQEQEAKVKADKENEFRIGHDGCWVSHPYFIEMAMNAFIKDNQLERKLESFSRTPDLIMDGKGPKTLKGLRTNIRVGIAYMRGWKNGQGCVAWDGLMEDLATLEISRGQTWQWLHHKITLDEGMQVTEELIGKIFQEELQKIIEELENSRFDEKSLQKQKNEFIEAAKESQKIFLEKELRDFLTV